MEWAWFTYVYWGGHLPGVILKLYMGQARPLIMEWPRFCWPSVRWCPELVRWVAGHGQQNIQVLSRLNMVDGRPPITGTLVSSHNWLHSVQGINKCQHSVQGTVCMKSFKWMIKQGFVIWKRDNKNYIRLLCKVVSTISNCMIR